MGSGIAALRNMCLRLPKRGGHSLACSTAAEDKKNEEIDRMIRRDKKAQSKHVKMLLLGSYCFLPPTSPAGRSRTRRS